MLLGVGPSARAVVQDTEEMVYSLLAVLSALHQTAFLLNGGIHHELEVWIFPSAPFSADSPMVGAVRASPENFSS